MEPIFCIGDYVGGNIVHGYLAPSYVDSFCIIKLETGEIFVRRLKFGTKKDHYHLIGINLDSKLTDSFLWNKKIASLAQIVWHRKNEKIAEKKHDDY